MACRVLIGGGLIFASAGCFALSLGAVQGQALIGRTLDVSIPLLLAVGETTSDACASAKVFYADDAVSSAAVRATFVASVAQKSASVRIQTTTPIQEAFVRIEVQVGCAQRLSRSYVLLADLGPADPPLSASATSKVSGVAEPEATTLGSSLRNTEPKTSNTFGAGNVPSAPALNQPLSSTRATFNQKKTSSQSKVAPTKRSEGFGSQDVSAKATQSGARLQLDPLELVASVNLMQPVLRMSIEVPLVAVESPDAEQRRNAARLLWKALNESPEQTAANALKAEASDVEFARIKATLAKAQTAEQAAQDQLLLVQQENRYAAPAFFVLLAALAVALAGVVTLTRREKRKGLETAAAVEELGLSGSPNVETTPAKSSSSSRQGWLDSLKMMLRLKPRSAALSILEAKEPQLDINIDTLSSENKSIIRGLPKVPIQQIRPMQEQSDFGPSALFDSARSVATEELFDLQQQVEFFISLGQAEQAIDVLKSHLAESEGASPLAYLDLLKLHHELGQRTDYQALCEVFNGKFNGNAPDFDQFATSRRGLERYEAALSRIQHLWPQPAVLQLIERSIFRSEPDDTSEVFDLEAYRELLLLYGIARELIGSQSDGSEINTAATSEYQSVGAPHSEFIPTELGPLPVTMVASVEVVDPLIFKSVASKDPVPLAAMEISPPARALQGLGLDLDLSFDEDVPFGAVIGSRPQFDGETQDIESITLAVPKDEHAAEYSRLPSENSALDLDFSNLSAPAEFVIKKSGKTN